MRKTAVLLAAACALTCAHVRPGPPALFPVRTAWVAHLDDVIESLASDGTRVFAALRGGGLRALDPSGTEVFRGEGLAGQIAAAPGSLLLRQEDGTLLRLEPATGTVRWRSDSGIKGALPPVLDGDRILVAGAGLAAVDAANGRVLWSQPDAGVTAVPVSAGPWIFTGEADGTLRCRDRQTGLSIWTFKAEGPILASPVFDPDGRVYVGTTDLRIVSLSSDKGRPGWRWKVGADVAGGGVLFRDGVLYHSYDAVLYDILRRSGRLKWRAPLVSRPLSAPILVGESILVACRDNDIVGINGLTGKPLGTLKTPAEIKTAPVVVGDRLYVALRDRSVMAYQLDMTVARPSPSPGPPGGGGRKGGKGGNKGGAPPNP